MGNGRWSAELFWKMKLGIIFRFYLQRHELIRTFAARIYSSRSIRVIAQESLYWKTFWKLFSMAFPQWKFNFQKCCSNYIHMALYSFWSMSRVLKILLFNIVSMYQSGYNFCRFFLSISKWPGTASGLCLEFYKYSYLISLVCIKVVVISAVFSQRLAERENIETKSFDILGSSCVGSMSLIQLGPGAGRRGHQ